MSTPAQKQATRDAMLAFVGAVNAKIAEVRALTENVDASTLEGRSVAQLQTEFQTAFKSVFQGATTATTADNEAAITAVSQALANLTKADVGLADVVNAGFVDTAVEANYADTVANVYTDPKAVWAICRKHLADAFSTSPEMLDTISEVTTAIQNNQDTITALNAVAASKVSQADFDAAVANLNGQISALWASDAEVTAGTATDKVMSVKQTVDAIDSKIAIAFGTNEDETKANFEAMTAALNPAPLA